jgi:hypothetical protein
LEGVNERLGEVIEASTGGFSAQCYKLYELPALGELVKCHYDETEILAITCGGSTSSFEPGRRPIARGHDETSEDSLYQNNPQLNHLLRSEFGTVVVGFKQGGKYYNYLPSFPVRLHSFVYRCSDEEIIAFGESLEFLILLEGAQCEVSVEELIAACIRRMSVSNGPDSGFSVRAGKKLTEMYSGDYQRLRAILARLR